MYEGQDFAKYSTIFIVYHNKTTTWGLENNDSFIFLMNILESL